MEILLSLITSGSMTYIVILLLVFGIVITLYKMHMNSLNNEVERATQKNIIKQLEQNVKDKDLQLQNTQELMNKEVLTAEERDFINSKYPEWAKEFLFHNFWNNTYLNLAVYSEVEHEQFQFRMERGY